MANGNDVTTVWVVVVVVVLWPLDPGKRVETEPPEPPPWRIAVQLRGARRWLSWYLPGGVGQARRRIGERRAGMAGENWGPCVAFVYTRTVELYCT